MIPPVVASHNLRFKFVLRIDHTDRKEKPKKLVEKYGWAKRIHRFREIRAWTPPGYKIHTWSVFGPTCPYRYYSSAEPLYESYNNNARERHKALKSRQRENSAILGAERPTSFNISWNFRFSKFSGHMTPPVVPSHSLRFKFVLRFDHTDRKEKPKKCVENYGWAKRIHRFREIRAWTHQRPKIDTCANFDRTSR